MGGSERVAGASAVRPSGVAVRTRCEWRAPVPTNFPDRNARRKNPEPDGGSALTLHPLGLSCGRLSANMLACKRAAGADARVIGEGSVVVVYENRTSMKAVSVKRNARYDSRFGNFLASDWIGLPFGSKVFGAIPQKEHSNDRCRPHTLDRLQTTVSTPCRIHAAHVLLWSPSPQTKRGGGMSTCSSPLRSSGPASCCTERRRVCLPVLCAFLCRFRLLAGALTAAAAAGAASQDAGAGSVSSLDKSLRTFRPRVTCEQQHL